MSHSLSYKRILMMVLLVGVISGLGATLFFKGVELCSELILTGILGYEFPMEGETVAEAVLWTVPGNIWLILPILIGGALISGLIVWKFAPETEGHGTDAALKSYHSDGKIRRRVPLVKAISAIITISSGGSAGCEGPTAQISAGFGSIISDVFKFTPEERKMAIAIGIGAGVGAIFKAPIGGALLAAEILYLRDCKPVVFFPALLASCIGYAIFGFFFGYSPLFSTIEMDWSAMQLPLFLVLGLLAAGMGILYIKSFYGTKKIFDRMEVKWHIPKYLKPVIGAAIMGLIIIAMAYIAPEALIAGIGCLGTGYGFVQLTLFNMLPLATLLILPFAKILCTSLTIGSGASGGVFAPGLSIGAFTGAAFALCLNMLFPAYVPLSSVPLFAIIGMIAMFGGVSHAPFAILIMVIEMTGSLTVLIPAILAVIICCLLMRNITIFKQQRISETDNQLAGDLKENR
ncbi:MAG TPA: chloride channel protein [Methanocorpusculum sp.]|nr:chloride channel protein [Methanocorpusculum sp.]